jgi:hypothetical protein
LKLKIYLSGIYAMLESFRISGTKLKLVPGKFLREVQKRLKKVCVILL